MKQDNGLFSLQLTDAFKAAIMTVLTTLLASIYPVISNGAFPTWEQFKPYLFTSISAGVAYLLKNYLSNNNGQFAKKDLPLKTVPADAIVVKPEDLKPAS